MLNISVEKSLKRAMRRHHKRRMIQKAKNSFVLRQYSIDERLYFARKFADHLKNCSCEYSCGNVRHNGWSSNKIRLTRQERKSDIDFAEQRYEMDEET